MWELAEAQSKCLVTVSNHLLRDKTVRSVSAIEICHVKYFFLMLKAKFFSFPADKSLTKPS